MLDVADWTYQFSDDPKAWRKGKEWFELLRKARVMADTELEPRLKEIFETIKANKI